MEPANANIEKTVEAVLRQVSAMGAHDFEIGLFDPDATRQPMLPRTWDVDALVRSVPWMRLQNRNGRNIYIRPKGEHSLSLVDDLPASAINKMTREGFSPALVVRTSPGNHQAWLKHPARLDKELGTAVARALAERFGGDRGAADWRHFGRLAGFVNRKRKYCDPASGLHPYVLLIEAKGAIYSEAERFLAEVSTGVEQRHEGRQRFLRNLALHPAGGRQGNAKTIEDFRSDGRYGADGNRIDLAYAVYALAHGEGLSAVMAAIRSRDLSHKGNERRQDDYVERTIRKAQAAVERQAADRGR